jgi:membrane fusion protein (multidrug efflux system)
MNTTNPTVAAPPKRNTRFKSLLILTLIFSGAGAGWYWWWMNVGQFRETTDNAYVAGNIVQITPQIAGTVIAVNVNNTDHVQAGQVLVQLDDTDTQVALQSAEANLADAVRSVRGLYANTNLSTASVTQMRAEVARTRHQVEQAQAQWQSAADDYQRVSNLRQQRFIAESAVTQAKAALEAAEAAVASAQSAVVAAQANLAKAQAQQAGSETQTAETSLAEHPKVQSAAAQVRQAFINQARTQVLAPTGGDVAQRSVQVGNRVAPGMALMAVIPPEQMWVDANFKETQLANIRIGQTVHLTSDVYGKDVVFSGKIAGFSAGTGSAFALLPPQNASGNWIKIIQRVPVRIELEPKQMQQHPLRIGLSMRVDVDTHNRQGAVESTSSGQDKLTLSHTNVFTQSAQKADDLIAHIITANSGKQSL